MYDPNETIPGGSDNPDPARWVSAIAYPLKAPDGSVREVALVHQDITARRKAEDEMSFQKMLLEALTEAGIATHLAERLSSSDEPLIVWDVGLGAAANAMVPRNPNQ